MNDVGRVRAAIHRGVVEARAAPSVADIARSLALDTARVAASLRRRPMRTWWYCRRARWTSGRRRPSAVPTAFRVHQGDAPMVGALRVDAFGISAALRSDVTIVARCAASGEPPACGVSHGTAHGSGIIHLLVPAARFWDDIVYT